MKAREGNPADEPPEFDDLESLLRARPTPMTAPPGTWENVRRRARRRRWLQASVSVAAIAAAVGVVVPVALHVRGNRGGQQRVTLATRSVSPSRPTSSTAAIGPPATSRKRSTSLRGFQPTSLSFVTQTEGYLLGPSSDARLVLAHTLDGGRTWTGIAAPTIDTRDPETVRFATSNLGFIFGQRLYATRDGGQTWTRLLAPGFVDDLATMDGKLWALVSHDSARGAGFDLYEASVLDPVLRRVRAVPRLHGGFWSSTTQGTAAVAVNGSAVDVISGREFYSTPDGRHWIDGINPCPGQVHGQYVLSTAVTAWSPTGVVAVCGENAKAASQYKQAYVSTDGGRGWTTLRKPGAGGYLHTLGAGSGTDIIIGSSRYGAQLTRNGGKSWTSPQPDNHPLGFVGFIDPLHIVALPDNAGGGARAFLYSYDGGRTWSVTRFPV